MVKTKRMDTNSYLRIEKGFDISKITGVIPQNIGEGFQFDLSDKTSVIWKKKKDVVVTAFGWDAKTS